MLKDEACDSLRVLMPKHFELWVCAHRAAGVYDVLETIGFWKVESVDIDLENSGAGYAQQAEYATCLSGGFDTYDMSSRTI